MGTRKALVRWEGRGLERGDCMTKGRGLKRSKTANLHTGNLGTHFLKFYKQKQKFSYLC